MAFLNLNIRGRLILGFSVLCALLACVVGVTIIKVGAVNESTDRNVNLRVPTAMAASDVVAGVYASLASLRGWLITGNDVFKAERATLWKDIQRHGSAMDNLSSHWTVEQNKADWKQAKPLLDELRNAQDKAEAIAHTIDEQPAAKILATEAAPLARAHAAKGDVDHRRGRRHCVDRCAQEPADRVCRHARQHGDGDRCDPRLSADRGRGLQERVRGSLGAQPAQSSRRSRSDAPR